VPLPKYPAVQWDIALLCDKGVTIRELEHEIWCCAVKEDLEIEKIQLFDIYTGERIEEGKQSVAFTLTFRANDRSMTSEEVEKAVAKILKGLEGLAELRA